MFQYMVSFLYRLGPTFSLLLLCCAGEHHGFRVDLWQYKITTRVHWLFINSNRAHNLEGYAFKAPQNYSLKFS